MAQTKLTPKQLFEQRNTSDVFNREVLIGMLKILNRKLVYTQIWDDSANGTQNVTVPFFYDFGGSNINSERFIQDNYTFFTDTECTDIGLKRIDGNFDFYPQGRISLQSVQIDAGNITNRFSRAKFTRYEDGQLRAYTAYLYSMPLTFQFTCEIRCENMNTAFKIDQAIREFFYKNKTYRINYKGVVCPVRCGFPESALNPNPGLTYTMGSNPQDNWIKLTMNLQCETYQPVFDPFTEMPADCSIGSVGINLHLRDVQKPQLNIKFDTDFKDMVLTSGQEIMFEWTPLYQDRDLLSVDILYQIEGDSKEYLIESVDNHNFYHWRIPENFTDTPKIDLMVMNTELYSASSNPEVYIYPDPITKTVDPMNVYVKNKGFFLAPQPDFVLDAVISYENLSGRIIEYPARVNLHNYMISPVGGVDFKCFVYENNVDAKRVRVIVQDHNNKSARASSEWFTIV